MKHYVYFSLAIAAMLMQSCTKHEEIEFEGKTLWVRQCTASFMDTNAGYVVKLDYPEGVGATIEDAEGNKMENIVVLYEPTSHIHVGKKIHGKFYLDSKYTKVNCSLKWDDYELPEGVFTYCKEDKE